MSLPSNAWASMFSIIGVAFVGGLAVVASDLPNRPRDGGVSGVKCDGANAGGMACWVLVNVLTVWIAVYTLARRRRVRRSHHRQTPPANTV